jgi:small GTP-binding protein
VCDISLILWSILYSIADSCTKSGRQEKLDAMSDYKGETEEKFIFKVILIGDGAVGKTSLVRRYMEGKFEINYLPTIGTQIYTKTIGLAGRKIKLVIWDISGQPAFTSVRSDYYRGARGVILAFDLTRLETYEHLNGWINETKKHTTNPHIVVVGSKSDLELQRKVKQGAGEAYASEIHAPYIEASAKEGKNVEKVFAVLANDLMSDSEISQRRI